MNSKTIIISVLIGILLGIVIGLLLNSVPKVYEKVITRSIIEDSDNLLKLLDEQKYIEASYLAESISTQWWFLRNAFDTEFYNSLDDERRNSFWGLSYKLEYLVNCTEEMEVVDCLNFEESIRADIKFYQKQICPKSDLYNSKYVMKNFGDYPEQMEKLLEKVKC